MVLELVPDAPHLMVDSLRELFRACITAGTPKWWLLVGDDLDTSEHQNFIAPTDSTGQSTAIEAAYDRFHSWNTFYILVDYAENQKAVDLRHTSTVIVSLVSSDPYKPVTLGYGHVSKKTRLQIDIRCGDNPDPQSAIDSAAGWVGNSFTAGSTTTVLKDSVNFNVANDTYKGYYIYLPTGERRRITTSTQATTSVTVAALAAAPASGSSYILGPHELTGRHRMLQLVSQIRNGLMAIRNLWDDANSASPTGYNHFGSNYLWLEIANPEATPEREANAWRYIMEVDLFHPFQPVPEGGIQTAAG